MMYATTTTMTAPLFGLRREIDKLFEDTFGRGPAARNEWTPAVDIRETDAELTLAVELPGIQPENVEVSAVDGVLTIQGERADDRKEGEDGRYYLVERNHGSFMRRFQLPQGVDSEKILADVENGILQIHIPKAALAKPKKIQVTAGSDVSDSTQHAIGRGESRQDSRKVAAVVG
jgi:Molecular chaperone (small heat shock protein)